MEASLKKRAAYLAEMGEKSLSDENASLWQVICRGLDTIVTVLGDLPCDRDAFLSQLKTVFSAVDIGRIPAYIDQVTVGSADMLRLYEKKHIYLIGVNDGRFPSTVSDSSYFTERDRMRLVRSLPNGVLLLQALLFPQARFQNFPSDWQFHPICSLIAQK